MIFRQANKEDIDQIAELLVYLLGRDFDYRKNFVEWKYFTYLSDNVTAAVAEHNAQIVGFRGLSKSEWIHPKKNGLKVGFYSDAVVHPEFRGRNILAELNNFISQQYTFDYVLAFSSNEKSSRTYIKQGAVALMKKFVIRKIVIPYPTKQIYNLIDLKQSKDLKRIIIDNMDFTELNHLEMKLSIDYLNWKLSEPQADYRVIVEANNPKNYLLIRVYNKTIEVFDYNITCSWKEINNLLTNYTRLNRFMLIVLPLYNPNSNDLKYLNSIGYNANSFLKKVKKNLLIESDILIRPFKTDFQESDFWLENVDLRDEKNWRFRQLYYV